MLPGNSRLTMREHWESGLDDIRRTLAYPEWLERPDNDSGTVTHDGSLLPLRHGAARLGPTVSKVAAGADSVMIGGLFAAVEESPGEPLSREAEQLLWIVLQCLDDFWQQ